jgi:hypothetical protein
MFLHFLLTHTQPTYKAGADATATAPDEKDVADADVSTWTYDWKADKDRGISLGQHYKAIGDQINAHYREAFDPANPAAEDEEEEADNGRRLTSKDKKKRDKKREQLAEDMAAQQAVEGEPGTGWYDWSTDRDRGMAIGMHYKQMGDEVRFETILRGP